MDDPDSTVSIFTGNSIGTKRVKGLFLCNLIDKLTGLIVMVIVVSNLKNSTVVHSDN